MNQIEQLTRQLSAALQQAPEYARFVAAKAANESDEILANKMREIELVRMQYQHEAQKAANADKNLMDSYGAQFRALHEQVMINPRMQEYQAAGTAMDQIIQRITGIIAGCAQGEDPATYEPEQQGCGGGGCGGGGCSGGGCG